MAIAVIAIFAFQEHRTSPSDRFTESLNLPAGCARCLRLTTHDLGFTIHDSRNGDRPALQELHELVRRHGFGEEISLAVVAAEAADDLQLLLGLDTLGERIHPKILGERDDGLDDLGTASI